MEVRMMVKVLSRAAVLLVLLGVLSLSGATMGRTVAPGDRQAAARQLLASPAARFMTPQALMALTATAGGERKLGEDTSIGQGAGSQAVPRQGGLSPNTVAPARLANVRVNDPGEDSHQVDQTTQSETSIAAVGDRVAVGFNDSQTTLQTLTAGSTLAGYGYSTNGGATFTDGGPLPNQAGCNNFGDPWLAADRGGAVYYSTLTLCAAGLFVGVARSTDGGRTFSAPTIIVPQSTGVLYQADKDAMTAGPDPHARGRDNLYDTWDDFTLSTAGSFTAGLAVARSVDGGTHWQVAYASQVPLSQPCPGDPQASSFTQYIGAQPLVDPGTGALYVAAEKLSASCPSAAGAPPNPVVPSEVIFTSTDGGLHFGPEVKVADITFSFPQGALELAPGRLMRNLEFPTLALLGPSLELAWNDGRSGQSHILLSQSSDGTHWSSPTSVTAGSGDELQPSMSSDGSSLQVLYYQRNPDNTLDVLVASSAGGTDFRSQRVTTQSFSGALTLPHSDPVIAPAYMGDYIDNVASGGHRYFAWGDNRDTVTGFLYPQGRPDPDVFFARR
jgi:hypothetical protein